VALFSQQQSPAVGFLSQQQMTQQDAANYVYRGIAKRERRVSSLGFHQADRHLSGAARFSSTADLTVITSPPLERRLFSIENQTRMPYFIVGLDRIGLPMATWQVQEAKTRLSEVIERARTEGPQTITRHGAARAVVLSIEDYDALAAHKPDFKAHLLGGPKFDEFSVARDRDLGRDVEI
jgi:prevent-host-death family protein